MEMYSWYGHAKHSRITSVLRLRLSVEMASLILFVAAFVFLCKIYWKMKKVIVEQHDLKKAQDEQITQIIEQEAKYPEWRKQSLDIQKKLTERMDGMQKFQEDVMRRIEEIEAERRKQKRNELRERLLYAYRYYTSKEVNPKQAWSEMEAQAFWDMFGDYEKNGGDGHMHTVVQPAMRALEVIPMHETELVAELMQSRR